MKPLSSLLVMTLTSTLFLGVAMGKDAQFNVPDNIKNITTNRDADPGSCQVSLGLLSSLLRDAGFSTDRIHIERSPEDSDVYTLMATADERVLSAFDSIRNLGQYIRAYSYRQKDGKCTLEEYAESFHSQADRFKNTFDSLVPTMTMFSGKECAALAKSYERDTSQVKGTGIESFEFMAQVKLRLAEDYPYNQICHQAIEVTR